MSNVNLGTVIDGMPLERLTQDLVVEIAREFPTLSNLNLSKNAIREMDCDFSMLRFVTRLNLSHNQLDDLPSTLHDHLPQLTQLLLAHNNFTSLRSFKLLKTLTLLDLSNNCVQHVDQLDYLKALPLLTDLCLRGNPKLDQLDNRRLQILQRLPQLQTLDQEPVLPHEREKARRLGLAMTSVRPSLPRTPTIPTLRAPLAIQLTSQSSPQPPFPTASTHIPELQQVHQMDQSIKPPLEFPTLSNASKQVELMQHRIDALQEIITLQEAELANAVALSLGQRQAGPSMSSPSGTMPAVAYQKLLSKWRSKVFELVVAVKNRELAAQAQIHQAGRSVKAMEGQVSDQIKHGQKLTQRLADADAAAQLLQLQLEQLHADRTALQAKCQRHVHCLEGERHLFRQMAHSVVAAVQDEGMGHRLQQMYSTVTRHEQRLRRQVQHAEMLVVSLARKEARLRNQEAALEGERRVWIKRLQGASTVTLNPSQNPLAPHHDRSRPSSPSKSTKTKLFKLKPESEEVLRAVFHRLDPYQTGLVDSARFLAALQKDWTVRQAIGAAGVERLLAAIEASKLFGNTKHVTWGEFVLLFLPDLSGPRDAGGGEEDASVAEGPDGVPLPFQDKPLPKAVVATPRHLDEWTHDELKCHVVHLEQQRAVLMARIKEDANELQHRVRGVQQQWQGKCDAHVQNLATLQDAMRELERTLALQQTAYAQLEAQLVDLRAQNAAAEGTWRAQRRELELQLDGMARDHDKAMLELNESHSMALQEAAQQVRHAQKDVAKQDVYVRQLERHVKRLQDTAAAEDKQAQHAWTRQVEKRDVEIAKLRRERNALLTTVREQVRCASSWTGRSL
ncbi:hypothetical protein, variant [Aphanomyces invadans]|uniref:Coiled-coil alpha-helical rod protein 1 n=1 Tax=Aphanomyces invadans TaxID=157072 RepID=A0A024U0I9_9STRA|nr:hypothetical protein, variant [Aphanomyces invadans]ETV99754.1 hypothetical protein, variant [Aphanomyces invadans]|eukprot:XP_008871530.1 hypothetical protein, variant [Aphanomyces invadans]